MNEKNKYTVFCRDEFDKKQTIIVDANNKIDAKEIVLLNHPKFEVISVFSKEELEVCR